ncbi:ABC transporter substrate-binding protein [Leifsonia naganoensis]|uniref:Peptide/nickel transport system substrate-binding protein n=1 Tax=Leifsonia naganoensis TaxID=150025 RepID=A0A853DPC2_9MICO|nr:ABC transporter substrate-binding protein [Leifsonia naganoensis]NYK10117.1 peptide/nickel transport system substrate-binding protein [Leifsonia naganoensis]
MRITKTLIAAIALVGGTALLSGCAAGGDAADSTAATAKTGGTLVYATGDDEPPCLDSANRGNVPQALLASQYLETLFYQDKDGTIEPWLAKSWKVAADGLSVDVTVRDGVTFSDGTPLTSEAVKANIERVVDGSTQSTTGRLALYAVKGVDIVDATTARINLSTPDSALLESLSQIWLPIESPTAIKRSLEENCVSPVGTGPFVVQSWTKQDNVTLVKNSHYTTPPPGAAHTGAAYLDKIVWKFVPDASARFAALQSGDADVIDTLQPENAVAAKGDPALAVLIGSRPGAPVQLTLNTTRAPFDDASVRKAFFESLDVDSALKSVYLGTVDRSTSLLSTSTRYGVSDVSVKYDPKDAGKLLDAAGWSARDSDGYRVKDGKRLTVVIPTTVFVPLSQAVYEQFQATAKKVGFDVQLNPQDSAGWWSQNYAWNYDAIPIYYTKNSADVLRIIYWSKNATSTTVNGYHSNNAGDLGPEIDGYLTQAEATTDDAQRAALYKKAQDAIAALNVTLPIYDQQTRLGYRADVKGIRFLPSLTLPSFYDAWLDK